MEWERKSSCFRTWIRSPASLFCLPWSSGISAWIATSTPRLSYLGVQMALAFYLINLQEFAPQYSLAIARDRIVGVLLGLVCMWLVFDRLWVRDALQEMQDAFARNLRLLAELLELRGTQDKVEAIKQAIQLAIESMKGLMPLSPGRRGGL